MFSLTKKKTLIIEDFTEFARSVRTMLYSLGNESVDIVNNAESAIESCKGQKYDILLSDYNLGEKKDGQQLLEELMAFNLLKTNCIFIMLTAENTSAMVMGALEYQPDNYIAKPFTAALLKSRIMKASEKKSALTSINKLIKNNKWNEALEQCDRTSNENPKYRLSCLRLKFNCLKNINQLDEALNLTLKIIADREIPWALLGAGEVYFLQKKYEKANGVFNNMVKKYPMYLEAYDWLAKCQTELGKNIDAQETIAIAVKKAPKVVKRQKSLGIIAEVNKDFNIMTKAYRQAIYQGKHSAFAHPDEYIKLTEGLKSLSKDSKEQSSIDAIINEAETTFKALEKKFQNESGTMIRSNVAHASFSKSINNQEGVKNYTEKAQMMYDIFEGEFTPEVSLEIAKSLREINANDFAEEIIQKAIEQNLDNQDFIAHITSFTEDKELILQCKQASQQNEKGIFHFRKNDYKKAIMHFEKASSVSPKNINIALNFVQALLKASQNEKHKLELLNSANEKLSAIKGLEVSDHRFSRYSELSRLTQLMINNVA